jgi:hypothetical protein
MRWAARLVVCAALSALVALAVRLGPGGVAAGSSGPVGPPDPAALARDPDTGLPYLRERFGKKLAIVRDLAEGRSSLWQAAARLRELDRAMPPLARDPWARPWLARPVPEDELCCRDVLHMAHIGFDDAPGCRERLDLWDCELEARLADGPVELPAVVQVAE